MNIDSLKETLLYPFKAQKKQTLVFLTILMAIMIVCVTCGFTTKKNVNIIIDSRQANTKEPQKVIEVSATLVDSAQDVLDQADIVIADDETVNLDLKTMVKDIDEIHITKKIQGVIIVDGKEIQYSSAADNVSGVLSENNVSLGSYDEVSPKRDTVLSSDVTKIKVTRVEVRTEGSQKEIPYSTITQENADLTTDTRNVISVGKNGLEAQIEAVTYRDGVESGRIVIFKTMLSSPITEVVEVGTKLANGGNSTSGHSTINPGDEMDFICAVVAQEGGHSYEGALAVISCIMNRVDAGNWGGNDVISVITAPGQFSAYLDGDYQKYMGAELPEVRRAVTDCMVNGIRSHGYMRFRGYEVEGGVNICGNYYF